MHLARVPKRVLAQLDKCCIKDVFVFHPAANVLCHLIEVRKRELSWVIMVCWVLAVSVIEVRWKVSEALHCHVVKLWVVHEGLEEGCDAWEGREGLGVGEGVGEGCSHGGHGGQGRRRSELGIAGVFIDRF